MRSIACNGLSLTHMTITLTCSALWQRPVSVGSSWVPHAQAGVHGYRAAKYINNERQTSSLGGCEGQGRECAVRGGVDTYATVTRRPALPLHVVALRNTAYKGVALYQTSKPSVIEGRGWASAVVGGGTCATETGTSWPLHA
jgi:hypothetical protein